MRPAKLFVGVLGAFRSGARRTYSFTPWLAAGLLAPMLSQLEPAFAVHGLEGLDRRGGLIRICREAWLANVEASWAATGSAKYGVSSNGKEIQSADVEVEVSQDKYRLEATYTNGTSRVSPGTRKIILREPTAVFYRMVPKGGSGTNHVLKEQSIFQPPSMTDFPFSPIRPMRMMNLGTIDQNKVIAANELESGDIELLYSNPPAFARLICAKKFGYNYSVCEARRGAISGPLAQSETLEWKKLGDRWYVTQIVRWTSRWENGKKVGESRSAFSYTSFEHNRLPDDSRFTLDSLNLPSGSRIQDRRPGATEKNHYYRLASPPKPNEPLDKLVDRMPVSLRPHPWYSKKWFKWSLSAAGLLVLAAGAFALYRRRRRGHRDAASPSGLSPTT